jgi:hypothetical protein
VGSSSLAAYSNGTPTAAAATGLLLLTFGDRLVLRTLAVNLVFLGALLGTRPAAVEHGDVTRMRCELPAPGAYSVKLFSNTAPHGSYHYVGQVEANRED